MATAEFSKFASILSAALSQHHLLGFEKAQLEFHMSVANFYVAVQSLSHVYLFATSWTAAQQAPLSFTVSWSLLKLMSIKLLMPSNHLILCRPLLLPPSIFPSIRVFSRELSLHIRWSKYWSFSFSIIPSNEYSGLVSFRIDSFRKVSDFYSLKTKKIPAGRVALGDLLGCYKVDILPNMESGDGGLGQGYI